MTFGLAPEDGGAMAKKTEHHLKEAMEIAEKFYGGNSLLLGRMSFQLASFYLMM